MRPVEQVRATELGALESLRSERAIRIGRGALIGSVFVYLGVVLIGPMTALVVETHDVGFRSALDAISTPGAIGALRRSLLLVGIALIVNALVGLAGAIALVRHRFPGRGIATALCDLPLAVSPVMIGLAFLLLLGRDGALSPLLEWLGVKVVFSFPGLVVATLFVTLPYTIREVMYVLDELGTTEEEAAATLGASPWQTFYRVTLPNVRLALGYGLLMTAARTLGEFGAVLVLGGSIAGKTQTATTFIHDAIEERNVDEAYGMALLLGAISVVLLLTLELLKARRNRAAEKENDEH